MGIMFGQVILEQQNTFCNQNYTAGVWQELKHRELIVNHQAPGHHKLT